MVFKTAKPQQKKCSFKTADFRAVLQPSTCNNELNKRRFKHSHALHTGDDGHQEDNAEDHESEDTEAILTAQTHMTQIQKAYKITKTITSTLKHATFLSPLSTSASSTRTGVYNHGCGINIISNHTCRVTNQTVCTFWILLLKLLSKVLQMNPTHLLFKRSFPQVRFRSFFCFYQNNDITFQSFDNIQQKFNP